MRISKFLESGDDFEAEMFAEVVEAVYAEDLARACAALEQLHSAGSAAIAELLRRSKRRAAHCAATSPKALRAA